QASWPHARRGGGRLGAAQPGRHRGDRGGAASGPGAGRGRGGRVPPQPAGGCGNRGLLREGRGLSCQGQGAGAAAVRAEVAFVIGEIGPGAKGAVPALIATLRGKDHGNEPRWTAASTVTITDNGAV